MSSIEMPFPGGPPPPQQARLPQLTIQLEQVPIGIQDTPDGKRMVFGPILLEIVVPFDAVNAEKVGAALAAKAVQIAGAGALAELDRLSKKGGSDG